MSSHSYREQMLAFAGIWQAVKLVQQIAYRGNVERPEDFETCIRALFVTDPKTTDEVYGGPAGVATGLNVMLTQFGDDSNQRDMELTKYVIALMHLERRLARHPEMLARIGEGIEVAKAQAEHFSLTHENVIARLADLYKETISTLPPKIIVNGEQGHLSNPANAARVRALLLSGIRSTVLWYQLGGRRLKLLFSRARMLEQTRALLREAEAQREQP